MRALLLAGAALIASPAWAQDHSAMDHSAHQDHTQHQPAEPEDPAEIQAGEDHANHANHEEMDHGAMGNSMAEHGAMDHSPQPLDIPFGPPPPRAFEGPEHAADLFFDQELNAQARAYNHAAHGNMMTGLVLAERMEVVVANGEEEYVWDLSAWYGNATDKFVLKTEGEGEFGGAVEEAEVQLLWGHAIGPWFDLQAGVRLDAEPNTRAHAVFGVAGLAPYMIHVDGAVFLSDRGDLTARIEAEHDIKFTQRLILQPRVEFELAAQDIPARAIGAGLFELSAGARLRYEIDREFAPYFGVEYAAATGRTADIIRAAGDDPDGVNIVLGLRFWF